MRLSALLSEWKKIPADCDSDITHLALDSRQVVEHSLFFAIQGQSQDGRQYIPSAILHGAVAILIEAQSAEDPIIKNQSVPVIPILSLKEKVAEMAACFYGYPAKKLSMIGVTGTSGKTSCTHYFSEALPTPCGVIGTLGAGLPGALVETGLTTPDPLTLHQLLAAWVKEGIETVAMEVSSHSIDQGRINGIDFEIGIFTNLTQDHLDYHGCMEAYGAVKYRFLASERVKQLIINAEDDYGKVWLNHLANQKPVFAYSTQKPLDEQLLSTVPFVYAEKIQLSLQGIEAKVISPWGSGEISLPLIGRFNLSNALAVLTALCLIGIPFDQVLERLSRLKPVAGRMQILSLPGMPLVVVDYSHKPGALFQALQALRAHCQGRLICVFGCGGERDVGKRPQMARIAEQFADQVIVTNDNPRHESPEAIVQDILKGFSQIEKVTVLFDRSQAIQNSIQWAGALDCILIAGKGAEAYQLIGDKKWPFDDMKEASRWMVEKSNVTVVK